LVPEKDDVIKYCGCMEEIKLRVNAINDILSLKRSTTYPITNAEFLCLQVRKVLELIALSNMAANIKQYSIQNKKFRKHWHAERILNDIEKINPKFYPYPTYEILDDQGRLIEVKNVESGFLTKEDFINAYSKVSSFLHAVNPYGNKKDTEEITNSARIWIDKILKLLNRHHVQLIDNNVQIWVIMQSKIDGKVHASGMKRIE
jgi:hypothetical protein